VTGNTGNTGNTGTVAGVEAGIVAGTVAGVETSPSPSPSRRRSHSPAQPGSDRLRFDSSPGEGLGPYPVRKTAQRASQKKRGDYRGVKIRSGNRYLVTQSR
jgi:hypothetical protein